jgi:hypothetical protein
VQKEDDLACLATNRQEQGREAAQSADMNFKHAKTLDEENHMSRNPC